MFKAKDIMTADVVTVEPDDTVDHAMLLMVKHRISGLPVVDASGCPLGIVSEFDLLELACEGQADAEAVSNYMSAGMFALEQDDNWVHVADMFRTHHVRRLPVLNDGKLIGIVTRHNLMQAILDTRQQMQRRVGENVFHARRSNEGDQPEVLQPTVTAREGEVSE